MTFLNFWPTDRIFQEDYAWETDVLKKVLAGCFRHYTAAEPAAVVDIVPLFLEISIQERPVQREFSIF